MRWSRRWRMGGVDHLFFTSGSEIAFYQESIAKARHHNRPAPRLITVTHEHVSLNAALGLCRGQRQVRGDGGACRCRHAALWLRRPYRVAQRPAGADDRGCGACGLSRQHAGLARGGRASLGAAGVRPERHRPAIHQMGQAARIPGQSRPDGQPRAAGGAVRAVRPGLYQLPARDHPAADERGASSRPPTSSASRARLRSTRMPRARSPSGSSRRATPIVVVAASGKNPETVPALVALCELLGLPVVDAAWRLYHNFPMNHPLFQGSASLKDADAVLVLEANVPWMPGAARARAAIAYVAVIDHDPAKLRYPDLRIHRRSAPRRGAPAGDPRHPGGGRAPRLGERPQPQRRPCRALGRRVAQPAPAQARGGGARQGEEFADRSGLGQLSDRPGARRQQPGHRRHHAVGAARAAFSRWRSPAPISTIPAAAAAGARARRWAPRSRRPTATW